MASHSHEPSYYEIALTNRQVLTVFVILLVCIVVAFFSGVWVGRQETSPPSAGEVARQEIEPSSEGAQNGDQEIGNLNFFSDRQEPPAPLEELAAKPDPRTTLLEDLGGTEPSAEDASAPAGRRQTVAPVEATGGAGATEPSAASEHVIQVFSSTDEAQARRLLGQLTAAGYPAFLSPVDVDGQAMYRVRIGPYQQEAEAQAVADRVRRAFKLDTWVTR